MSRVALLGVGAMGSRIAQHLIKANHQIVVYNRTADRAKALLNQGAVYAATPREAAEQSEVIISMVTDEGASRTVWLDPETGAAMGLSKDAIAIESSTALAEVIGMLTKNGVTSAKAMECLGELPVISPAAKGAGNLMVSHNHAPMFPVDLVEKDFRYFIQNGQSVKALLPTSTAVHEIYQQAITKKYGSSNITGVSQLFI